MDDLGGKPFELWELVPESLLPVEEVAVSELRWHLALPFWRDGDRHFAVSPNGVRADPSRYAMHWQRTLDADLEDPVQLLATAQLRSILR